MATTAGRVGATDSLGPTGGEGEGPAASLAPGDVLLGKYRVERVLGRGGMGVVYEGFHLLLEQRVALKVLASGASEARVDRLLAEAKAQGGLKSQHIARVLDVDWLPDRTPLLVIEHLEGRDLEQVLADEGPLPTRDAARHVLEACEGLAEAHAAGIVHRDLKPANLFITRGPDGKPLLKVLDFGIAAELRAQAPRGVVVGSPRYMSPEHLRGEAVDARADIWSLGIVLHRLATGRFAYDGASLADIAAAIEQGKPELSLASTPDEEALLAVVTRCLAQRREDRFADVAALARALAPLAGPQGAAAAERVAGVLSARAEERGERAGQGRQDPTETLDTAASEQPAHGRDSQPSEAPRRARGPLLLAALVAAAALALLTLGTSREAAAPASSQPTPPSATAPAQPPSAPPPAETTPPPSPSARASSDPAPPARPPAQPASLASTRRRPEQRAKPRSPYEQAPLLDRK